MPKYLDHDFVRSCLEDYVKERMSPYELAEHMGVSTDSAYELLWGRTWKKVPRPEGFQYPWPERQEFMVKQNFKKRLPRYRAGIKRYETEGWTLHQLADHLGIAKGNAWELVARVRALDGTSNE